MFKISMGVTVNENKIEELLTRGVDELIVADTLREDLVSGRTLRVKLGIDPTSEHVHLGRTVPLLKLRDFQDLGHTIVLIIGDFTGVIGDTSDKEAERPMLSPEEIAENQKSYLEQIGKIIDTEKAEIRHNSEWLGDLTYREIGEQANWFSVADFISRDNIKKRLEGGTRVSLREMLYPLMQGYDSVAIEADVELGGVDQRFNLLAGRTLQEHFNQRPQNIIMGPLVAGLDGRKMSSSWGNTINILDEPNDMFGKIMRLQDELLLEYFTLLTRIPTDEVANIETGLTEETMHPKDAKMKLASEIVTMYHGARAASEAENYFSKTFSEGIVPESVPQIEVLKGSSLSEILIEAEMIRSKNEFRTLVDEGGITNVETDEKISDINYLIAEELTLKVGKRRFIKITVT